MSYFYHTCCDYTWKDYWAVPFLGIRNNKGIDRFVWQPGWTGQKCVQSIFAFTMTPDTYSDPPTRIGTRR